MMLNRETTLMNKTVSFLNIFLKKKKKEILSKMKKKVGKTERNCQRMLIVYDNVRQITMQANKITIQHCLDFHMI